MTGPRETARGAVERRADVRCPFCDADDAERLSLFGSQLLTEQWYCRACHTPFERVKDDDEETAAGGAESGWSVAPPGVPR